MAKRVFIAATRQNEGKTTVALGLLACLAGRVARMGFIKPVGQRYVEIEGHKIDEDALLVRDVFDMPLALSDMSPVAVARRFTRDYIDSSDSHELKERISEAFDAVASKSDLVIVEGTGHAGVGSCFDLSNAMVAKLLDSKVVLVTGGGIGRPIDEVMLNRCLFAQAGVEILGVVINKVHPEKVQDVEHYARKGLKRLGIDLLGVVPYRQQLVSPTMRQILEETGGEILHGAEYLDVHVSRTMVGAMTAHQALKRLDQGSLLITGGDREDLVLAALGGCVLGIGKADCVSGILLTGGIRPHHTIMKLIHRTSVPIILVETDSYSAASKVGGITYKIRSSDKKKISIARRLVHNCIDVEAIIEAVLQ